MPDDGNRRPRQTSVSFFFSPKAGLADFLPASDRAKVRKAMEATMLNTVMKIVTLVNAHKDHIPPMTNDANPFPYQINIHQKEPGWATRMGIY